MAFAPVPLGAMVMRPRDVIRLQSTWGQTERGRKWGGSEGATRRRRGQQKAGGAAASERGRHASVYDRDVTPFAPRRSVPPLGSLTFNDTLLWPCEAGEKGWQCGLAWLVSLRLRRSPSSCSSRHARDSFRHASCAAQVNNAATHSTSLHNLLGEDTRARTRKKIDDARSVTSRSLSLFEESKLMLEWILRGQLRQRERRRSTHRWLSVE